MLPLFDLLVFRPQTSSFSFVFFFNANKQTKYGTASQIYKNKAIQILIQDKILYQRTCQLVNTCLSRTLAFSIFTSGLFFKISLHWSRSEKLFHLLLYAGGLGCWCRRPICLNAAPYFERQLLASDRSRAKWPSCGQHVAPGKDDWTTAKQHRSEMTPFLLQILATGPSGICNVAREKTGREHFLFSSPDRGQLLIMGGWNPM